MANTFFKSFSERDRTSSRTLLHENIPITGTIISGTYDSMSNVKSFSHGMFKSVYDYPYVSSSANHIFDVTYGILNSASYDTSTDSFFSGEQAVSQNAAHEQEDKKQNMYTQMAQILMGYDVSGNVRNFDFDGNLAAGLKFGSATFLNLSRLLVKDEIKKGSFSLVLGNATDYNAPFSTTVTLSDVKGADSHFINSPAGEYGILYTGSSGAPGDARGLIFYQAGIAVLPSLAAAAAGGSSVQWQSSSVGGTTTKEETLVSGTIDQIADSIIHRIQNVQFNNTTELNSTIYFCRANHNEFNYSSNPTYLSGSKIVVKGDNVMAPPRSYVTTVGLYSADNELLAVAKLSEPLRKDPTNELTLRVRLDY